MTTEIHFVDGASSRLGPGTKTRLEQGWLVIYTREIDHDMEPPGMAYDSLIAMIPAHRIARIDYGVR